MIFPKGEARYRNLLTAFADLSALLSVLTSEGFSGTLEVEFPENCGVFFVDSGEIINAEAKAGADLKRLTGSEAVRYLLSLAVDLKLLKADDAADCRECSDHVVRALQNLLKAVRQFPPD